MSPRSLSQRKTRRRRGVPRVPALREAPREGTARTRACSENAPSDAFAQQTKGVAAGAAPNNNTEKP
jgi:hypothetical protein